MYDVAHPSQHILSNYTSKPVLHMHDRSMEGQLRVLRLKTSNSCENRWSLSQLSIATTSAIRQFEAIMILASATVGMVLVSLVRMYFQTFNPGCLDTVPISEFEFAVLSAFIVGDVYCRLGGSSHN
jgi:hypothetical protein